MNLLNSILNWYFKKEALPYWCMFLIDTATIFFSGLFTYWIFNKTGAFIDHRFELLYTLLLYVLLTCVGFRIFHTYSGILRYSSFVDLWHVAMSNAVGLALSLIAHFTMEYLHVDKIGILTLTETCTMFLIATLAMWTIRVLVKMLYDVILADKKAVRVLIYGAMEGAVGLAKYIRTQQPAKFVLMGFIAHEKSNENRLHHVRLMGKKVYNTQDNIAHIIKKYGIKGVLISPTRTKDFQNDREMQNTLISTGVKIYMTISAHEMQVENGKLTDSSLADIKLKEVSVEDLPPRDEIQVDMNSVGALLRGKKVLITGSAGSIGSEMVHQIAIYKPAEMMLIDQAETPQHDVRLMMSNEYPDIVAHTVVTSICKEKRMEEIFSTFQPDYVFHAAAYKHVPMMEDNPSESIQNNVWGTKIIADLSVKYNIKKFVMISTDKAVNPTNVMGCSKRICEIYVQSLDKAIKDGKIKGITQFVTTRFGNVLGSNGSVIPLFRKQLEAGGPLTVTHPKIIRYFMLIPEACKLVLEAGTHGKGGEIFVFDMGEPVLIADLAKRMIQLSGAKNVEIKYTGLREGEKLYEEVLNEKENTKPSFHEKIRIAEVRSYEYEEAQQSITELYQISAAYDDMNTVRKMKEIVPEYISKHSRYEALDQK